MSPLEMNPLVMILCCAAATYFWRAAGALTAGKINTDSPIFILASCITYAMVAALILRMIVYPAGATAVIPLSLRLIAVACGLAVFAITRRNVAMAAWSSVLTIVILNNLFGTS